MPEEKEKAQNGAPEKPEEEKDPLEDLLFEEEEKETTSQEVQAEEGPIEKEEGEDSSSSDAEGAGKEASASPESAGNESLEESETPEEEDPLASILGEEEEEESPETKEELGETAEEEAEASPEESPEPPKRSIWGLIFTILAFLIPLLLFGAGVGALWYLYRHPPSLTSKAEARPSPPPSLEEKNAPPPSVSPIAVEDRKILFLRNFLIPYRRETGEFVFVKAKVLLYFANSKEFELAKRNETLFREEIYRLFKNTPLYLWESKRGAEVLQREIMAYLTKNRIGGVVPVDLQVTGYILK